MYNNASPEAVAARSVELMLAAAAEGEVVVAAVGQVVVVEGGAPVVVVVMTMTAAMEGVGGEAVRVI